MNRLKSVLLLALFLLCVAQPLRAQSLDAVLAQMDAASQRFQNARAEFQWDYYETVSKDTTTQTGFIYFQRAGGSTQMGADVAGTAGHKGKVLEYKSGVLRFYDADNNQVQNLKAGSNQGQYESFLTLGFGGSGRELARTWNIKDLGAESISDDGKSVKTEKLDLVSKDPGVLKMFTHVTIWVDIERGVSLKQVFETPSHNRRTATYSGIKVNEKKLDTKPFAIPKGAKLMPTP